MTFLKKFSVFFEIRDRFSSSLANIGDKEIPVSGAVL